MLANRQCTTATDTINFINVHPVCPGTGAICWRVIDAPRLRTELDLPCDQFDFSNKEFLLNCGKWAWYDEIGHKSIWDWITEYSIFYPMGIKCNGHISFWLLAHLLSSRYKWRVAPIFFENGFSAICPAFSRHNKSTPMTFHACEKPENWRGREIKTKKERSG